MTIPIGKEKIKVRLAFTIATGARTILVNEIIDTLLLVALKTIKTLSIQSKALEYKHMIFFD